MRLSLAVQSTLQPPSLSWASLPGSGRKSWSFYHCPIQKRNALPMNGLTYPYNSGTNSLLTMNLTCPRKTVRFSTLTLPLSHPLVLSLLGSPVTVSPAFYVHPFPCHILRVSLWTTPPLPSLHTHKDYCFCLHVSPSDQR